MIYDAGDARTTWVSFWKAVALLQFGTTLVFAVPPLWNNENQPDVNLRKGQAILGMLLIFIARSRDLTPICLAKERYLHHSIHSIMKRCRLLPVFFVFILLYSLFHVKSVDAFIFFFAMVNE